MKRITIHNIGKATAQEVFDFIANHLLKQNAQCRDDSSSCKYRVETGNRKKVLKCAAGCLIPRKDYDDVIEGKLWDGVFLHFKDISKVHSDLVSSFQHLHDHKKPDQWRGAIEALSFDEGLMFNF